MLERIHGHEDLSVLHDDQRAQLCHEIRRFLVENVAKTGGHLASNLGVVELTVAIETVFDTNKDRLVFDVGHQSYVHKLLTGRQTDFQRLRQYGGIAGFPKPGESPSDAFVAGHASSSVSIALGMARARKLTGEDYHVIALVGDGAATGGMVYEALNDAGDSNEPMIILLNDNEMSIDRNVGGFARHLARLRTKERYLGMKYSYRTFLRKFPGGKLIYKWTSNLKNRLKRMILPSSLFEHMGLTYLGPVDGHDLPELIRVLKVARDLHTPVLIHVLTQKGHGYSPAEAQPAKFHGIGAFDPETGKTSKKSSITFSDAFGETLTQLAAEDPRVCAITAAMPAGTGLLHFKKEFPERLFDVGIAEEHAISMAGGLAKQGAIPVAAVYSTFLQRSFDQILQDICMLKLHAVLAVDRAGLVGEDGETHHGVFDVGFLRQAPGMTVLAPVSVEELRQMLTWAVRDHQGPVAIRYSRGGDGEYTASDWGSSPVCAHLTGGDATIITYGGITNEVLRAARELEGHGIHVTVLRLLQLAPLDIDKIRAHLRGPVFVVEETAANSGIAQALALELAVPVRSLDLGNEYVPHGSVAELYHHCGLDHASIAEAVRKELHHEN